MARRPSRTRRRPTGRPRRPTSSPSRLVESSISRLIVVIGVAARHHRQLLARLRDGRRSEPATLADRHSNRPPPSRHCTLWHFRWPAARLRRDDTPAVHGRMRGPSRRAQTGSSPKRALEGYNICGDCAIGPKGESDGASERARRGESNDLIILSGAEFLFPRPVATRTSREPPSSRPAAARQSCGAPGSMAGWIIARVVELYLSEGAARLVARVSAARPSESAPCPVCNPAAHRPAARQAELVRQLVVSACELWENVNFVVWRYRAPPPGGPALVSSAGQSLVAPAHLLQQTTPAPSQVEAPPQEQQVPLTGLAVFVSVIAAVSLEVCCIIMCAREKATCAPVHSC
jgi:hypothetical protein